MLTIFGIVRKSRQMEQWEKDWLLHVIVEHAKSGKCPAGNTGDFGRAGEIGGNR